MRLTSSKTPAQITKRRGFTLVELLIVIVVIAILAAITIIAYNGVTKKAVEAAMQSDLKNAATVIEMDHQTNGVYPATAADANNGKGLASSGADQLTYTTKPYGYCLSATNPKTTATFQIKSSEGQVTAGDCSAQVTTLAGSGTAGFANGTGTAAKFNQPEGVAVDSSGTVYVADSTNQLIRKISPAGVVTILAGSGTASFTDGTGTAAQFNYPRGVAVDSSGTVYVADTGNNRIRKISPAGVVTTLAGSGTAGFADGTGTAAKFNNPRGVAVDSSGTVYVADASNQRIRKITPNGVVTTLAGSGTTGFADGTGTAAKFNQPYGAAVDSSGTVYVADNGDNRIRKVTPTGVVTTLAGSGTAGYADGTDTASQFNGPRGVAVGSSGTVYVGDYDNNRIRVINQ